MDNEEHALALVVEASELAARAGEALHSAAFAYLNGKLLWDEILEPALATEKDAS